MNARAFLAAYDRCSRRDNRHSNQFSRPVALALARSEQFDHGYLAGCTFARCTDLGISAGDILGIREEFPNAVQRNPE